MSARAAAPRLRGLGCSEGSASFSFLFAAGALLGTLLAACSAGEQRLEPADLDPDPPTQPQLAAAACRGTDTGCPCADEGASLECGTLSERRGDYAICAMGSRTCSDGVWSECVARSTREL